MRHSIRKAILTALGLICLSLGAVGTVLPLLPTTPFLLLAAYFFSRGCQPLHDYLANLKGFGPILRNWELYGVIPLKAKRVASLMILLSVSYPLLFLAYPLSLKLAIAVCITLVIVFLWSRPSQAPQGSETC